MMDFEIAIVVKQKGEGDYSSTVRVPNDANVAQVLTSLKKQAEVVEHLMYEYAAKNNFEILSSEEISERLLEVNIGDIFTQ